MDAPVLRARALRYRTSDKKMNERLSPKLEEIYRLINADRFDEANERIAFLESPEKDDPIVFLFKALCSYERADDLECMEYLVSFIGAAPASHPKVKYARFTLATCLQNLSLDEEALGILRSLPGDYPDLGAALAHSEQALVTRRAALDMLKALRRLH